MSEPKREETVERAFQQYILSLPVGQRGGKSLADWHAAVAWATKQKLDENVIATKQQRERIIESLKDLAGEWPTIYECIVRRIRSGE